MEPRAGELQASPSGKFPQLGRAAEVRLLSDLAIGESQWAAVSGNGDLLPDRPGRREGQVLSGAALRHNMAALALMALSSPTKLG